jgi:hypothetical protein
MVPFLTSFILLLIGIPVSFAVGKGVEGTVGVCYWADAAGGWVNS